MASRDLHNNIKITPCVNPAAAITGNGTTTGATIDTQGFESLEFVVQSGVMTDGSIAWTVYEGDASNMSDEASVAAADLIGTAPTTAATDDGVCEKVGYKGNKRYVRIKGVQSGATSGGFVAAVAIQGHARNAPVA